MKHVLKLFRVHHWVKNFFIFLPLFFAGKFFDLQSLWIAFIGFLVFSFTSSVVYILNDYKDIEKDKNHPKKKFRPLASGAISKTNALLWIIPLVLSIVTLSILKFSWLMVLPLVGYLILNILYTVWLKTVPILDVTIIALGFVLRVIFGGLITSTIVSKWGFLLTCSLALVLALGKRRGELISASGNTRKSLEGYTIPFIDTALTMTITVTLLCYIMYTISPEVIENFGTEYIYITILFVLMGLLRYLQQTMVFKKTESPTKFLLKDGFTQTMVVGWVVSFLLIIYFK